MLLKDTKICVSFHSDEESLVLSALMKIKAAGYNNIILITEHTAVSELIVQSEMVLIFLSKAYVRDDCLMLEEVAYASAVMHKPFLPVWLDSLEEIRRNFTSDPQRLSALEMLTAKHPDTDVAGLAGALEQFMPDNPPYTPSTPQVCEKPCGAYEGDEPYIFISYAHDDAKRVYPIVKNLYEAGWDLWYDEGVKITQQYLPVIADAVKHSTVFVLILTNRCLEQPFVMNCELEFAQQLDIPILPVLLEDLIPPNYAKEIVSELMKTAVKPEDLPRCELISNLPNLGKRRAVAPAIRQNVVYDIMPEIRGFKYYISEGVVMVTRYTGNEPDVIIPSVVTHIAGSCFSYCHSLKSILIPNSVLSIGHGAFFQCSSLQSAVLSNRIKEIAPSLFEDCFALKSICIPDEVTCIGDRAFSRCRSLRTAMIPDSVKSIGESAFYDCYPLSSVNLPENITVIEKSTFSQCALHEVVIPNSVTRIEAQAFSRCRSLTDVTLPEHISYIAENAFDECPVRITGRGHKTTQDVANPRK